MALKLHPDDHSASLFFGECEPPEYKEFNASYGQISVVKNCKV
jgi:hypothetical protein